MTHTIRQRDTLRGHVALRMVPRTSPIFAAPTGNTRNLVRRGLTIGGWIVATVVMLSAALVIATAVAAWWLA